jgi:CheY-like chemotaxis protein
MSKEIRERCLEPFYTTKGEKGTGLGLAVVYGIAKRHGATMEIESEPDVGTTFIFKLPAFQEIALRRVESKPEGVTELLRVLVVDDQAFLREILRQYLTQDWHEVETASSGAEALAKFDAGEFDLVITDQAMPEQSGNQLVAAIKERAPHQRVMMLTGFGAGDEVRQETGADAILSKRVSREALRRGIAEVMRFTMPRSKASNVKVPPRQPSPMRGVTASFPQ